MTTKKSISSIERKILLDIYRHICHKIEFEKDMIKILISQEQFEKVIKLQTSLVCLYEQRDYTRASIGNTLQNWKELDKIWKPGDQGKVNK